MAIRALTDFLIYESQKEINMVVPVVYDQAACGATVTVLGAEAGTYVLAYSFEAEFLTKDKPLAWQVTGNFASTDEFALVSSASELGTKKNRFYAFSKEFAGGDLTFGMKIRDVESVGNITVSFCDVSIHRVK